MSEKPVEKNRNDGRILKMEDFVAICSEKCPNDPHGYNVDMALCQKDGSVWIRIGDAKDFGIEIK